MFECLLCCGVQALSGQAELRSGAGGQRWLWPVSGRVGKGGVLWRAASWGGNVWASVSYLKMNNR